MMNRIVVIGTSGSGKTTLAKQIALKRHVPHIELDALNWQPNWQEAPLDEFRVAVENVLQPQQWVLDGNYRKVRDIVWKRADTLVWLDYPLRVILWRLTQRIFKRTLTRENLWGTGNRETLWKHFFTRDSLYLWVFKTYRRRRREYPQLFQHPEHAHLQVIHLKSPRKTEQWLNELDKNNL